MNNIAERFLKYVSFTSTSNESSTTTPSTEGQLVFGRYLVDELKSIGMSDVEMDSNGYIMATLPSNVDFSVPTIGFISHLDTSPDMTAENTKPQIIENYDGKAIVLNEENNIILDPTKHRDLLQYQGQDIIVTDGNTLLGADDKAGVTEIVSAMEYLIAHPEIKHGKIRIGFTPDEEIGRGADKFDVKKFDAQWAYTIDGGEIGELEYENFNAAGATITFKGLNVHPGYAKNKMINSIYVAQKFMELMPQHETPETTSGYEGFYHLTDIKGSVEVTTLHYIIRDHDNDRFNERKKRINELVDKINQLYESKLASIEVKDQYYNMREKIEPVMHIVETAKECMEELGIIPKIKPIRGGTDGSRLSFEGLPCPNIFAGGHNFHGRYEYLPIQSMEKAVALIVKIAEKVKDNSLINKLK